LPDRSDSTFYQGLATAIDFEKKIVFASDGDTKFQVPYDKLVVAIGSQPATFGSRLA